MRNENQPTTKPATPAIEFDFNTPTPRARRAKFVKQSEIMERLRQEFSGVHMEILNEFKPSRLLNFDADFVLVNVRHGRAVERRVQRRARALERLALFRNADIKFGFRRGKGGWWQTATAH
jgi:hypothetical protein